MYEKDGEEGTMEYATAKADYKMILLKLSKPALPTFKGNSTPLKNVTNTIGRVATV